MREPRVRRFFESLGYPQAWIEDGSQFGSEDISQSGIPRPVSLAFATSRLPMQWFMSPRMFQRRDLISSGPLKETGFPVKRDRDG